MKIGIVDDEELLVKGISYNLESEGYEVVVGSDGAQAVQMAADPELGLLILDVMMPVMDGIAACTEIRTFSRVPVLMVTARGDEETEVSAMRCGADQFISKPIKMRAFMERVRSLLRRAGTREVLRFGRLEIDLASNEVLADGEPLSLTPKEYDLLLFLAQTPDTVRSREQILHAVWNTDYYGDGRTVDTHVKNLRMKLGDCGSLLRTVRSRGYMLESGK